MGCVHCLDTVCVRDSERERERERCWLNNIHQILEWTEAGQEFRAAWTEVRASTLQTGGQAATEASLSVA